MLIYLKCLHKAVWGFIVFCSFAAFCLILIIYIWWRSTISETPRTAPSHHWSIGCVVTSETGSGSVAICGRKHIESNSNLLHFFLLFFYSIFFIFNTECIVMIFLFNGILFDLTYRCSRSRLTVLASSTLAAALSQLILMVSSLCVWVEVVCSVEVETWPSWSGIWPTPCSWSRFILIVFIVLVSMSHSICSYKFYNYFRDGTVSKIFTCNLTRPSYLSSVHGWRLSRCSVSCDRLWMTRWQGDPTSSRRWSTRVHRGQPGQWLQLRSGLMPSHMSMCSICCQSVYGYYTRSLLPPCLLYTSDAADE